MKLGVVYPTWAMPADPGAIRDFAQTVEALGYDYVLTYESLIDTRSEQPPAGWHEPFTSIAYMAGCTTNLAFATGVTVLPSRQTLLIAKQVAQLDLLTGGRLRFGVSVGWNKAEYQAMGIAIENRVSRIEEQIAVLRALWTEPFVTFSGKYHEMNEVGVYPPPPQRPVPIWLGGGADAVLRRIARLGDGWLMYDETPATAPAKIDTLKAYAVDAGRDPNEIGLNIVGVELGEKQDWASLVAAWAAVGVTYLDVSTWKSDWPAWQKHLQALIDFKNALG